MLQELALSDVLNVNWASTIIKPGEWVKHHLDQASRGFVVGVNNVDVMVLWSKHPDPGLIDRLIQAQRARKGLAQSAALNYNGQSMSESLKSIANLVASDKIDPNDLIFTGSPIVDFKFTRCFRDSFSGFSGETPMRDVSELVIVCIPPGSKKTITSRFTIDMMNAYVHDAQYEVENRW